MASHHSITRWVAILRYHRPSQFAWRLCRMAQRRFRKLLPKSLVFRPTRDAASWNANGREAYERIAERRLLLWPDRGSNAAEMAQGRFRFLNETIDLAMPSEGDGLSINWNPGTNRLWRFHLQCQESLPEIAASVSPEAAYALVHSWLVEPRHASPLIDPDAWHPFCISRRIPVWLSLAAAHQPPPDVADQFWRSISDQLDWLRRNLERDLGGNHLLENLTTLYLAECFLSRRGRSGEPSVESRLLSELEQQILPSGEHFERTPTYHALMMVCVLQCVEAARFASSASLKRLRLVASEMLQFAMYLRQPDGRFPLLSDSAQAETPDLDRLFEWAGELWDADARNAPNHDYWLVQSGRGDRILFDTGALACDHLPAHGHADLLQVTATIGGYDAIVDTGTFDYEPSATRQHCRGTAAHNVVQIGQQEQCEVWSSFRMGRRGHIVWRQRGTGENYSWCAATHDGFDIPVGRIVVVTDNAWTIIDWFESNSDGAKATSRLHWHPDWQLSRDDEGEVITASHPSLRSDTSTIHILGRNAKTIIEKGSYYPTFGKCFENEVIVSSVSGQRTGIVGFHIVLSNNDASVFPSAELSDGVLTVDLAEHGVLSLAVADGRCLTS